MNRYSTVLFDLDHTLLDSDASEREAFATTLSGVGVGEPELLKATYDDINRTLWARVEAGEVDPDFVKVERFVQLVNAANLDADPEQMAHAFAEGLGNYGQLYEGARDVLERLLPDYRLALITNGLSAVQRRRLERLQLNAYFDTIVISAEVGHAKPATEIFDAVFDLLDWPKKSEVTIVGDSLTSDIAGGINYGIDTIWLDHSGQRTHPAVTHHIANIAGVVDVLT